MFGKKRENCKLIFPFILPSRSMSSFENENEYCEGMSVEGSRVELGRNVGDVVLSIATDGEEELSGTSRLSNGTLC